MMTIFGGHQRAQPFSRAKPEIVVTLVRDRRISTRGFRHPAHLLQREDPQERSFAANRRADDSCSYRQSGHPGQQLKSCFVVSSSQLNFCFPIKPAEAKALTGVFLTEP